MLSGSRNTRLSGLGVHTGPIKSNVITETSVMTELYYRYLGVYFRGNANFRDQPRAEAGYSARLILISASAGLEGSGCCAPVVVKKHRS